MRREHQLLAFLLRVVAKVGVENSFDNIDISGVAFIIRTLYCHLTDAFYLRVVSSIDMFRSINTSLILKTVRINISEHVSAC